MYTGKLKLTLSALALTGVLAVGGCDDDDADPVGPADGDGQLQVLVVSPTGGDPDGFAIQVGDLDPVPYSETAISYDLEAGSYTVNLLDIDAPCTADDESKQVTVVADELVNMTFNVTCPVT